MKQPAKSILHNATLLYQRSPRFWEGDVGHRIEADQFLRNEVGKAPIIQWKKLAINRGPFDFFDDATYSERLAYAVALSEHPKADGESLAILISMIPEATNLISGLGTFRYRVMRALYMLIERGLQPANPTALWQELRSVMGYHPRFGPRSITWATRVRALVAPRRVFIIHGHEHRIRDSLAAWLDEQEVEPVILSQQVDNGMTIIEKLEKNTNCVYAIALLTSDDEARRRGSDDPLTPRARQNVILELGMFLSLLGRSRVRMLKHPGIEIPSDLSGIIYTECNKFDEFAIAELSRELKAVDVIKQA